MNGRLLNHQELLSIATKDEQYFQSYIKDDLQELAQRILGTRKWIRFRSAITVLSRFGYFASTTLSNITTPGEEFCEAKTSTKGFWRHLLMVFFNNELQPPSEISKSYAKLLNDVHQITFFLFSDFYELSKRITNFTYSSSEPSSQSKRLTYLYRFLGCLSLIKLIIDVMKHPQIFDLDKVSASTTSNGDVIAQKSSSSREEVPAKNTSIICHLCSSDREEPTSTLCGHIFCWKCIHNWLKERSECPICRTPTEPSRLIHLINFK